MQAFIFSTCKRSNYCYDNLAQSGALVTAEYTIPTEVLGHPIFKLGRNVTNKYNLMNNLHNRLTVELARKNEIFYCSKIEDLKISRITKFGGEML